MNLDAIKVDAAKIEEGVWFEAGLLEPRLDGLRLKVRGLECRADARVLDAETARLPRHLKRPGAKPDLEVEERILTRRLVDALLVDWDGMTGDDGQPEPYSREAAERYLADPDYATFRDLVFRVAGLVRGGYTGEGEAAGVSEGAAHEHA